jgi:hypothetical protein
MPISRDRDIGIMLFCPFSVERIYLAHILFFGIHHRTMQDITIILNVLVALLGSLKFFPRVVTNVFLTKMTYFKNLQRK